MRFFKYLIFIFSIFFSSFAFAAWSGVIGNITYSGNSPKIVCEKAQAGIRSTYSPSVTGWNNTVTKVSNTLYVCKVTANGWSFNVTGFTSCPSATEVTLKVPINAQKYQCVNSCQYALRACVDVDFESGMTCSAISTGVECGASPPKTPTNPSDTTQTPDSDSDTPAAPGQNQSGTNTNNANGTSTSTSTTTTNTTTTNNTTNNTSTSTSTSTTTNTTTTDIKIDLSSLESTITSVGQVLGKKLDDIKNAIAGLKDQDGGDSGNETGDPDSNCGSAASEPCADSAKDILDWLKGDGDKGGVGGEGDNPFGTDTTPERELTAQTFDTNIFSSNASCPADRTLSMTLFTGKTFSKSFSFSMWCDKLAIFGYLILLAAYAYAAYIVVSKS